MTSELIMNKIILNTTWRYQIASAITEFHNPDFDDTDWPVIEDVSQIAPCEAGQVLWLRTHFDMPPNDECSVWWLESNTAWPTEAHVWVNYEKLPLPMMCVPARWEITYAIAMDENIVTVQLTTLPSDDFWQSLQIVPYPCH